MNTANFQTILGANLDSGGVHKYRDTTKTVAQIAAANFYDDKTLSVAPGDWILAEGSDGCLTQKVVASGKAAGDSTVHVTTSTISEGNAKQTVSGVLADVSAASSIYFSAPCAGALTKIRTVLGGAITVADAAITVKINTVLVTLAAPLVIATAGSAAGVRDSATPSGAGDDNVVAEGDLIEVLSDGGSTTAATLQIQLDFTP